MLRAEDCICGTSTTGIGTLTLAACPAPPGGVDPFAAFGGLGLGTSVATPMTYCIREFTDATFATVKQEEKGIGLLTLGANIGATTLARTTPQSTATGCNTATPTYSQGSPSAISIGTAANTLVFVGASAADIPAYSPYFETGDAVNAGVSPPIGGTASNITITSGQDYYGLFQWTIPMLAKRMSAAISVAYTGGTPVSNLYGRLYAVGSNARPGKLLCDYGLMGAANASMNTATVVSSAVHGTGFMMLPGYYFAGFFYTFSGGSAGPNPRGEILSIDGRMGFGSGTLNRNKSATATGGSSTASDPANLTSYTLSTNSPIVPAFAPS